MKVKIYFLTLFFIALAFSGCESDKTDLSQPFVVGFANLSHDLTRMHDQDEIKMKLSEPAASNGSVIIKVSPTNAQYGVDFETIPSSESGTFEVPFLAGQTELSFTYENKIQQPYVEEDKLKSVRFSIIQINYDSQVSIQGYTSTLVGFGISLGTTLEPEIGGPNQGNQVFIDLSTELVTTSRRDKWDLGFYSDDLSRVVINGSLYMAAKQLDATNIDAVTAASVQQYQSQVAVGTFEASNVNYVDAPNGDIAKTAISEISANDNDNKVYLLNLGYSIGADVPPVGSVAVAGNPRGWKKIRILKNSDNYVLQYADLNSTTHTEVTIPRSPDYNFTFFSFNTQNVVTIEPEKAKWDLNFTVFTNEIVGSGSYGYSDFVLNNLKAGVKVYRVSTSVKSFENFALTDVNDANFTNDQRIIGAEWRDVFTGTAYTDRYYILKDVDGNYYKIKMMAFVNQGGVRGYPKFQYKLVQ